MLELSLGGVIALLLKALSPFLDSRKAAERYKSFCLFVRHRRVCNGFRNLPKAPLRLRVA